MKKITIRSFCLLVCMVAGCSSLHKSAQPITAMQPITDQPHPLHDQNWALQGKLGINVEGKRSSVFVDWQQRDQTMHLTLTGPLGRGLTKIISDAQGQVQVITTREKRVYANINEAIINELGWAFPVNQAKFWVTGRPDPSRWYRHDSDNTNNQGIYRWIQDDWRIEVQNVTTLTLGHIVPKKILFSYPGLAPTPDIKIHLVINQWEPERL